MAHGGPFRSKAAGTLGSIGHVGVSNLEQVTVAIDTNRHQSVGESRTGSQRRKTFGASGLRALSWLVPVLLVVICEAVAESGWLSPQVLPAPSKVLRTAVKRHRFRTSHPRQRLYTDARGSPRRTRRVCVTSPELIFRKDSLMSVLPSDKPSRRDVIGAAAVGIGALAGLTLSESALSGPGRTTNKVRLTWGFAGLNVIAKERGEFEKRLAQDGIAVEWLGPFPNHAPTLRAITGCSAHFSFGASTTPALAAIIAGSPLVFTQFFVQEPHTTAIVAKDDSGISKVGDLVGKSPAVNRSGLARFLLVAALEKYKVDRSKVKFVYLNPPDAAPALASGKVDAWAMWSPGVDIARLEYEAHDIFVDGRDLDFQIDFTSYLTTRKFATENPALVRAVNKAFRDEGQWASENSREAEHIGQNASNYSEQIRDLFITMKRRFRFYSADDERFVSEPQKAADWLVARKILPEAIKVSDHLAAI